MAVVATPRSLIYSFTRSRDIPFVATAPLALNPPHYGGVAVDTCPFFSIQSKLRL
ncbi:hypothetical protein AAKU55_005498 [Oxalobacteraceae bacterium GrIS 1.11]